MQTDYCPTCLQVLRYEGGSCGCGLADILARRGHSHYVARGSITHLEKLRRRQARKLTRQICDAPIPGK